MPHKIKITIVENGFDKEVEIEVPDEAGSCPKPDAMRVVNKRVPRLDGAAKVTGRARYAYDVHPAGMLWAKILRAPYGRSQLKAINVDAARKILGFKAFTGDSEVGKIYTFAGQPVCAVAAVSEEAADDAIHALAAEWEALPAAATVEGAVRDAASGVGKDVLGSPDKRESGNVEAALGSAPAKVEGRYQVSTVHHLCLETHGQTVAPGHGGDEKKLTVWASTQGVQGVHEQFVNASGLPAGDVEVICEYMGGGFGSKFGIGAEGLFAWQLAKATNAPIKLLLDRKGEFQSAGNRPGYVADIRAAATPDAKLTAFDMKNYGANSGGCPAPYNTYHFDSVRTEQREVRLNAGDPTAFRAPGHPEASFLTEAVVDDLAFRLGMDPLEFRRKHLAGDAKRLRQLQMGADAIEWSKKFQQKPGSAAGPLKRGVGLAMHEWGGGGGPSTPITVKIHPDSSVEVLSGTQDLGTGTRTVLAMIVAEELGLDPTDLTVKIGHRSYGNAGGSGGSTTCASVSPAAKMAGLQARLALLNSVAPALSAKPEELEIRDRKIVVKTDPTRALTWKQAAARLGMNPITVVGQWVPGLSSGGVGGCGFAEVEVDVETGRIHVVKYAAVQDSGLVINRTTWESQINGGVILGLGYALLEERHLDPHNAGFLNCNLLDYKVPMAKEIPEIVVLMDPEPERGVIGVGEPPIISPGGAISNAVFNATGVRMRHLPMTPDKFLMSQREQRAH